MYFLCKSCISSNLSDDAWSRLSELRAAASSVFGVILKIDSTKKVKKKFYCDVTCETCLQVCKKLQGAAAGSAMCNKYEK